MRDNKKTSHAARNSDAPSSADHIHSRQNFCENGSHADSSKSSVAELLRPETRESYRARKNGDSSMQAFSRPYPQDDAHRDTSSSAVVSPPAASGISANSRPIDRANQMIEQLTRSMKESRRSPAKPSPAQAPASVAGPAPQPAPGGPLPTHADYEILRELSRSESSVVYEAYDRTLRRYVAIKQLNEQLRADPRQSELFWHEARFLAGLVHENVCRVYSVNEQQAWIIMEMMNGSLDRRLAEGPLPSDLVRSILRQALQGLKYLHEQGKLHGEIKPSKLLLDDDGCIKLSASAGFSIGGEFRRPSGTQKYVAPELLRPEVFGDVGPGVDLYCLGLTALELLTGESFSNAFKGVQDVDDDLAWMRWHCSPSEKLPPLEQLIPNLPEDLAKTLSRMLAKPVADRYDSAAAALKDLEEKPLILVDVPQAAAPRREQAPAPVQIGARPNLNPTAWPTKDQSSEKKSWSERLAQLTDPAFLNKQTKNPKVAYAVVGIVVILMFLVTTSGRGHNRSKKAIDVAFKSTPAGAQVSMDGKPLGITAPGTIELKPGKYTFRAEMAGFEATEKTIEVKSSDDQLRLHFDLAPAPKLASDKKDDIQKPNLPVAPLADILTSLRNKQKKVAKQERIPPVVEPEKKADDQRPQPDARSLKREIAADFATYAPRLIDDRLDRETYLSHVQAILNDAWETENAREACEIADEHYRAARYINRKAPWVYYAYGLVLSKNKQSSDALAQFEVAAEQSLEHRIPLFAPLREVIRHRVLNDDFAPAVRDSLRLAQAVVDFADEGILGNEAVATITANVDFVGRIMGFVQGPAGNRARTTVDTAAWEGQLQAVLPSDQWVVYTEAREQVLRQYADQLAMKEQREKEFKDRVQEMRDSGETRSVQFASKVQGKRSRERTHSQTSTPLSMPLEQGNQSPSQEGQSNQQQNGAGSQQSTTVTQTNREEPNIWVKTVTKSKRTVDWSKDYESTKHLDPSRPQIRQPYVLRTYLPEDFELRRMMFLTGLMRKAEAPQS